MYAPVDEDNPNFMLKPKQALDNIEEDLGLICGDFNTALGTEYNKFGYTSDTHRKFRSNINDRLETGEDAVRCFRPDCHLY